MLVWPSVVTSGAYREEFLGEKCRIFSATRYRASPNSFPALFEAVAAGQNLERSLGEESSRLEDINVAMRNIS